VSLRVRAQVQALPRRLAASERLSSDSLSSDSSNPAADRPVIHVVAGVVIDVAGRVLIAQRPAGTHMAGGWEFPGGKLEPGEERLAGLARELREELGITLSGQPRPLIRVRHAYPTREVLLDMWVVKRYSGEARGLDGQALRWCSQDELEKTELLPADRPIVRALRLPERLREASAHHYAIRDSRRALVGPETKGLPHDTRLEGAFCVNAKSAAAAVAAGADFLVLCEPLASDELTALCRSVCAPVYAREIALEFAWALGATGIAEVDT
jgi:8-oxo-dGTP diphosphatase